MQLSETIKLYLTQEQRSLVVATMNEYIRVVNSLVSLATSGTSIRKYTSKNVESGLPSVLEAQAIRDAKSIVAKYEKELAKSKRLAKRKNKEVKEPRVPVLKRPCCYVNNQNWKINGNCIEFPVRENDKTRRISVKSSITERQKNLINGSKLGTLRIVYKGRKIVAQVVYEDADAEPVESDVVMGVDLGIKCPAVSYTSNGKVKFFGNGRKNKFIRRRFNSLRKKLQKSKLLKAVKRMSDKEQRIMRDIDHKTSRNIVNEAIAHNVSTIKLERLENIRSTTRTSRKNNHSLHTWSFYRLMQYIAYKAKRVGITVEFVNPAYTSQTCPKCGRVHHANDRTFICECGYRVHRDLLGAINICNSTEIVGADNGRRSAQETTRSVLRLGNGIPVPCATS